jgi:hypothetical protein
MLLESRAFVIVATLFGVLRNLSLKYANKIKTEEAKRRRERATSIRLSKAKLARSLIDNLTVSSLSLLEISSISLGHG